MGFIIAASQLILSLSILIVLHEMGHFFPAKFFGIKVEKFYLFFDPWFSLFKVKRGDTEYGIGWLPLGGYVKIAGMIDESFDTDKMSEEPEDWEFRAKPAWQRLIIMIGGVTVNFILGFLIFAMVLFVWGDEYLPPENLTYGIAADSLGQAAGFRDGDMIKKLDGKPLTDFFSLTKELVLNQVEEVEVERNGEIETFKIPDGTRGALTKYRGDFVAPRVPFKVAGIPKKSINKGSQIKVDDQVIAVNGTPTYYAHEFTRELKKYNCKEVGVRVLRGGDSLDIKLQVDNKSRVNLAYHAGEEYLTIEKEKYGFFPALGAGTKKGINFIGTYVKSIKMIFTDKEVKASESLGGFGAIGGMFGRTWNWERFWGMTAILSLILAFMNLLPIPILDGGHVMFLLYELITGRKPNEKFQEYAQLVGFVLIMGLMLYANGLDIFRAIGGAKDVIPGC